MKDGQIGFAWRRFWRQRRARKIARDTIYATPERHNSPFWLWVCLMALLGTASAALILRTPPAQTPDAPEVESVSTWDRAAALDPEASPSAFTWIKLRLVDRDGAYCAAALERAQAETRPRANRASAQGCDLMDVVEVREMAGVELSPVMTRCAIALRLYMWKRHDLRALARDILGTDLTEVKHQGSYACRKQRTTRGFGRRLSQHATANAIDISGFEFADGSSINLVRDWGKGKKGEFLVAARDAACKRFNTVLGPEYNRLHRNHFHFDQGRARICR